jgi:hypothetical protein
LNSLHLDNPSRGLYFFDTKWQSEYSPRTNSDGVWRLAGLPIGARAMLQLDDARFVRRYFMVTVGEEAGRLAGPSGAPLVARPGAILTGKVVDKAGKLVGGGADLRVGSKLARAEQHVDNKCRRRVPTDRLG